MCPNPPHWPATPAPTRRRCWQSYSRSPKRVSAQDRGPTCSSPGPPRLAYMLAVPMTASPVVVATTVRPGGPTIQMRSASVLLISRSYAYVSPAATMRRKNGQMASQSPGRAPRMVTHPNYRSTQPCHSRDLNASVRSGWVGATAARLPRLARTAANVSRDGARHLVEKRPNAGLFSAIICFQPNDGGRSRSMSGRS